MSNDEPVTDEPPTIPADEPEAPTAEAGPARPGRLARVGGWFGLRWARMLASIGAGLLMCAGFAPLAWWWAPILSFAVLAVVLTRPSTTRAGGFGYGFLFGLAFYLPLLPWISGLVGWMPWLALAVMCAVFTALFGLLAVVVRALPGWPLWMALVWVVQEWLKCSVPFGGFPWGVVGFSQTGGPLLPLAQLGGAPLLSLAVAVVGFGLAAFGLGIVTWWRDRDAHLPPAVVTPGVLIVAVLLAATLAHPQVKHSGAGAGGEPTVTVAAVQGNVPRLGLEFNAQRRAVLDNHVNQTLALAAEVRAGRAAQPQFVDVEVSHNGGQAGLRGYREMLERDFDDIPDLYFHIQLLVAKPPYVASRLGFDCTPSGIFLGLPVNGRKVWFAENVFYEFRGGKIATVWSIIDKAAIEVQL